MPEGNGPAEGSRRICPKCGHVSQEQTQCPRCGVIYAKVKDRRLLALERERAIQAKIRQADDRQRFAFGGLKLYLLALPAAVLFDVFLLLLILPRYLFEWVTVFFHELGHSLFHWLSSRAATPLALGPAVGWTSGEYEQSAWVGICVLFLISVMGFYGLKHRTWGLVTIASCLLAGWVCFTFLVPDEVFEPVMIVGGIGGELALGTLCIIGFYYRLPDRVRWDFFRFPALALGVYAYGRTAWMWMKISAGTMRLPYGSGLYGSGDAHGDMDRLRWGHGFSERQIIAVYMTMVVICGLVILAHYGFFAGREWLRSRKPAALRPLPEVQDPRGPSGPG